MSMSGVWLFLFTSTYLYLPKVYHDKMVYHVCTVYVYEMMSTITVLKFSR